jgi:uncharacterized protein DUF3310
MPTYHDTDCATIHGQSVCTCSNGPTVVPDEKVDHPPHYGGDQPYEHWKVMVAWGLDRDAFLYNCTKYLCRMGKKDRAATAEDLKKARWYLDRAIEREEKK